MLQTGSKAMMILRWGCRANLQVSPTCYANSKLVHAESMPNASRHLDITSHFLQSANDKELKAEKDGEGATIRQS
jgi:hypothetical protein